jgi:hypothetical protein
MAGFSSDGDIENLIFIIANLPEFLKTSVCRTKTRELIEMSESEKMETMIRSLSSLNLVDDKKLIDLTKTWMKVIAEIEPDKLTQILHCYLMTLSSVKLFEKLNPKLILDIFSSLEDNQRNKLMVCLKEALFLNPNRDRVLKIIPKSLAKVILN